MLKKTAVAFALALSLSGISFAESYKVGISPPFAPYEFSDEQGLLAGFDIDLIRALAEVRGWEIHIFNDPWDGLLDQLDNGSRDMIISGIGMTPARTAKYDFSEPYAVNLRAIAYIKPDLNITDKESLINLKLGAQENSSDTDMLKEIGVSGVKEYPTVFMGFRDVVRKKIDGVMAYESILNYTANSHPEIKISIKALPDNGEQSNRLGIAVKKGNKELLAEINTGLAELRKNGKYQKLVDKWLSAKR